MSKHVLEFDADTTKTIQRITEAAPSFSEEELVRDAVNTYLWLLQHQRGGYKVVVYKGDYESPEDPQLLANLWTEKK